MDTSLKKPSLLTTTFLGEMHRLRAPDTGITLATIHNAERVLSLSSREVRSQLEGLLKEIKKKRDPPFQNQDNQALKGLHVADPIIATLSVEFEDKPADDLTKWHLSKPE